MTGRTMRLAAAMPAVWSTAAYWLFAVSIHTHAQTYIYIHAYTYIHTQMRTHT